MFLDKLIILSPTIFAIYLILISHIPNKYWTEKVKTCYENREGFKGKTTVMANVALDWGKSLGYLNSMASLFLSLLVVYYKTSCAIFLLIIIVWVFIFILTMWWVFSFNPGDLVSTYNKYLKTWTNDKVLRIILLLIYSILGIAQFFSL